MNPVFLNAIASAGLSESSLYDLASRPLWRRMTPLQKAVMTCFAKLKCNDPKILEDHLLDDSLILYTSIFGDSTTMGGLSKALVCDDLPLSPAAFQNSVFNGALAPILIQENIHNAAFCLTSGYASADAVLRLAALRVGRGVNRSVILIHANELTDGNQENAQAEVLLLSSLAYDLNSYQLRPHIEIDSESFLDSPMEIGQIFKESEMPQKIPWFIVGEKLIEKRKVVQNNGTTFLNQWQKLTMLPQNIED